MSAAVTAMDTGQQEKGQACEEHCFLLAPVTSEQPLPCERVFAPPGTLPGNAFGDPLRGMPIADSRFSQGDNQDELPQPVR